jgi:hypothetical protein
MATNNARISYPVSGDLFAAILEQRMAEHKLWQHEAEYALIEEIIDEVQALPKRKPKTGRLFVELPEHMRDQVAAR